MKHYKSAESVTKGHPDKLCDYIADSILDGYLKGDESSRVAVEVMATKGLILVAGEVTSKAALDVENIVRDVLFDVGYEPQNFEARIKSSSPSFSSRKMLACACSVATRMDSSERPRPKSTFLRTVPPNRKSF
jgi:S-adenosylmethionine synthetase